MKKIFIFLSVLFLLNCLIQEEKNITISFTASIEYFVGSENAIFGLTSNTKDELDFFDETDIEGNTHFDLNITGNYSNTYKTNCRLWKDAEKQIILFCELEGEFKTNEQFAINETKNIEYKSKKVELIFKIDPLKLLRVEGKLPFIYSNFQEKSITEEQKVIEVTFKVNAYNDEPLFISIHKNGVFQLQNCHKDSNELKCEISREDLDIYAKAENDLSVSYLNEFEGSSDFTFVADIRVKYPNVEKKDIYFILSKIGNKEVDFGSLYSVETNITEIDKIKTSYFEIKFTEVQKTDCFLIKHDKLEPLYLSCYIGFEGNYSIAKILPFTLNDIHYKYNFKYGGQDIKETLHSTGPINYFIDGIYPRTLDFTSKNSLDFYAFTPMASLTHNPILNKDGGELQCKDIVIIKKCTITKDHFKNKKNGYYVILQKSNKNEFVANYESFGFNVILPEEPTPTDPSPGGFGNCMKVNKYYLYLFALVYFLI